MQPRTSVEHVDYAAHLHILDKQQRLVPYTPNRAQRHYREHQTPRDLILKSRQLGFSTEIQAQDFTAAVSGTALCATLAHDDATTQKLRRMAKRFYDHLPDGLKPPRGLDNATTTTYPATGSEVTIATAGSTAVGRGGTYNRVHGSEVAFWKDAESLMAGIMQGVPQHGVIRLESTPNGAQGWFYEKCMAALDGDSEWRLHFYPWWWDDGYALPVDAPLTYTDDEVRLVAEHGLTPEQIAWRRAKQKELGRLFAQEYPEDPRTCFLLSGEGYFGDLTGVFTAPFGATPDRLHRYYGGLDFAQTVDYTVLSIWDETTRQQVALLRVNRLPWAEMRRQIVAVCKHWNVHTLTAETNSMGSTNIEALVAELKAAGADTRVAPFQTDHLSKAKAMGALHSALHEGGYTLLPISEQQREFTAFQSRQTLTGHWQFSAPDGEHDDTVIANALALDPVLGSKPLSVSTRRYA